MHVPRELLGRARHAPDPQLVEIAQNAGTADPGPAGPEVCRLGPAHGLLEELEIGHVDAVLYETEGVVVRIEHAGDMDPTVQRQGRAVAAMDPPVPGLRRDVGNASLNADLVVRDRNLRRVGIGHAGVLEHRPRGHRVRHAHPRLNGPARAVEAARVTHGPRHFVTIAVEHHRLELVTPICRRHALVRLRVHGVDRVGEDRR